jgi:hypothetical protein
MKACPRCIGGKMFWNYEKEWECMNCSYTLPKEGRTEKSQSNLKSSHTRQANIPYPRTALPMLDLKDY